RFSPTDNVLTPTSFMYSSLGKCVATVGLSRFVASRRYCWCCTLKSVEASMNIASPIAFDTAELEYNEAWNASSNTRFELPPVDVNTVLKKRYQVSPAKTLTSTMIWDMETKKAWDPLSYIPYVVSQARSWGRTTLRDGSTRFSRSSLQRGWITP